jgi:hypothetical protein
MKVTSQKVKYLFHILTDQELQEFLKLKNDLNTIRFLIPQQLFTITDQINKMIVNRKSSVFMNMQLIFIHNQEQNILRKKKSNQTRLKNLRISNSKFTRLRKICNTLRLNIKRKFQRLSMISMN